MMPPGNPASAMITVLFNPPAITTAFLPAAQVGKPYSYRPTAVVEPRCLPGTRHPLPDGLVEGIASHDLVRQSDMSALRSPECAALGLSEFSAAR